MITATCPTVSTVLAAAADLLEERGWCRQEPEDPQGRHCILGALDVVTREYTMATGDVGIFYDAIRTLSTRLPEHLIVQWNDAPERTADDVITFLRHAAAEEATTTPTGA